MTDIKSSETVIPLPAVSSLSGNAASYESSAVTPVTGLKGGKRKGSKKKTAKKKRVAKRKSAKKCWWKFF
jgi:hypothetical protein